MIPAFEDHEKLIMYVPIVCFQAKNQRCPIIN